MGLWECQERVRIRVAESAQWGMVDEIQGGGAKTEQENTERVCRVIVEKGENLVYVETAVAGDHTDSREPSVKLLYQLDPISFDLCRGLNGLVAFAVETFEHPGTEGSAGEDLVGGFVSVYHLELD